MRDDPSHGLTMTLAASPTDAGAMGAMSDPEPQPAPITDWEPEAPPAAAAPIAVTLEATLPAPVATSIVMPSLAPEEAEDGPVEEPEAALVPTRSPRGERLRRMASGLRSGVVALRARGISHRRLVAAGLISVGFLGVAWFSRSWRAPAVVTADAETEKAEAPASREALLNIPNPGPLKKTQDGDPPSEQARKPEPVIAQDIPPSTINSDGRVQAAVHRDGIPTEEEASDLPKDMPPPISKVDGTQVAFADRPNGDDSASIPIKPFAGLPIPGVNKPKPAVPQVKSPASAPVEAPKVEAPAPPATESPKAETPETKSEAPKVETPGTKAEVTEAETPETKADSPKVEVSGDKVETPKVEVPAAETKKAEEQPSESKEVAAAPVETPKEEIKKDEAAPVVPPKVEEPAASPKAEEPKKVEGALAAETPVLEPQENAAGSEGGSVLDILPPLAGSVAPPTSPEGVKGGADTAEPSPKVEDTLPGLPPQPSEDHPTAASAPGSAETPVDPAPLPAADPVPETVQAPAVPSVSTPAEATPPPAEESADLDSLLGMPMEVPEESPSEAPAPADLPSSSPRAEAVPAPAPVIPSTEAASTPAVTPSASAGVGAESKGTEPLPSAPANLPATNPAVPAADPAPTPTKPAESAPVAAPPSTAPFAESPRGLPPGPSAFGGSDPGEVIDERPINDPSLSVLDRGVPGASASTQVKVEVPHEDSPTPAFEPSPAGTAEPKALPVSPSGSIAVQGDEEEDAGDLLNVRPITMGKESDPPVAPASNKAAAPAMPAQGGSGEWVEIPNEDPGSSGRPSAFDEQPATPAPSPSGGSSESSPAATPAPAAPGTMAPDPDFGAEPLQQPEATPRPTFPTTEAFEPVPHVVQRGENFWTISKSYYGDGRYYQALWAANREEVPRIDGLIVGASIRVPPVELLDRRMVPPATGSNAGARTASAEAKPNMATNRVAPILRAAPESPSARLVSSRTSSAGPDPDFLEGEADKPPVREPADEATPTPPSEPPKPQFYRVRQYETLRSIARDVLGDSSRARELYELNKDRIDDPYGLVPGTPLRLPNDVELPRR